jgi:hypothetical protein
MYDIRLTIALMGRVRRDHLDVSDRADLGGRRSIARPGPPPPVPDESMSPESGTGPRRMFLGKAVPRGYGGRPRLSLDAAASFATLVDTARARAAMEGRTLVYTVRWG